MPFFSVVIPVFNKGPHVARAIGSVMRQTFNNFELILVNDPSTDNSFDEIRKFKDPRIRIFFRDEPGPGGYAARNKGIKESKAEWVAFLDADDEWFPDHLEAYSRSVSQFPTAEMLSCGYLMQGDFYRENPYFQKNRDLGDHIIPQKVFFTNFANNSFVQFTSCACVKKQLLEKIGGFPEGRITKAGDLYTWFMCALNTEVIAWSCHLGAIYHQDSESMVTKTAYPSPDALLDLTRELLGSSPDEYLDLLKKIHNRRIITEYKRALVSPQKKFKIAKYLYFATNPLSFALWSFFDLFAGFFPQQWLVIMNGLRKRFLRSWRRVIAKI